MTHQRISLRAALCAGAALGLLGAAAPVAAEDSDDTSTEHSIIVTGEREVTLKQEADTGSRLGLTALETPASVNTVVGDDIRARGDFSVQAAVARAPGVTNSSNPGNAGSSYAMRGFAGATSVLQLYNGVRLYPVADSISFPNDPWNIDRVEILSGPASVMYGQGALGGAVNVIPKAPNSDRYEFEAEAGYGSDNTAHIAGGVGGPLGQTLSFRADASYRRSDGWVDRGDNHSLALSGALRWEPTDKLSITLRDDYGNIHPQKYFGTPLVDGKIDKSIRHNNYDVGDAILRFKDNRTIMDLAWQLDDDLEFRSTAYYMTSHRRWRNLEIYCWIDDDGDCHNGYGGGTPGEVYRSDNYAIGHNQKQYGMQDSVKLTFPVSGTINNDLLIGVDLNRSKLVYSHDFDTDFQESPVPLNDFDPGIYLETSMYKPRYRTQADTFAVFAEDRLAFGDKFSLVGGVRVEYNKTGRWTFVYDSGGTNIIGEVPALNKDPVTGEGRATWKSLQHTTWRVGAVYEPTPNLSFYAQYATAVDPIGGLTIYGSDDDSYLITNANGRQFEAGVKGLFLNGSGQFTFAAYRIDKYHLASQRLPTDEVIQIGHRSSQGIEASVTVNLPGNFAINANGAILKAEIEDDGTTPAGVPEQAANLELSWSGIDKLQLRGDLRYVGRRFSDDANEFRVPSYTVVDLSATYAITKNIGVDIRVFNVFDKAYAEGVYFDEQWILGRPRSFDVSVRAAF